MKKLYSLFFILVLVTYNSFSQSGNGHTQSTTLSYTPSGYSTATKMLQDAGSTALAKSTINNNATAHAFANFIFDTTGKNVYLRYTTNGDTPNKTDGTTVSASFSNYSDPNRTFTSTIPAQSAGTTVKYLFYISDSNLASAWGKIDANGYGTSWNEGSMSAFSYVVKTANTQTGTWATGSTWAAGSAPTSSSDVEVIASTTVTVSSTSATTNDLTTISSGAVTIAKNGAVTVTGDFSNSSGNVNLNSDSNEFASIIVQGTSSGNIVYKRYVADEGNDEWDLIGSPVAGQSISAFVSANSSIADEDVQYGIGVFSNNGSTDTAAAMYSNYTSDGTGAGNISGAGNFTAGQGYAMATDEADTPGTTLDFTGTIRTTDLTDFAIDDNSSNATNFGKWNLVANPFPSYLNANDDAHASNNFLTVNINANNLHDTYASVYGYDGDGSFTAYNHSSPGSAVYIAPGQGFFVASDDSGGNTISFTEAMQTVSGSDDFISGDAMDDVYEVLLRLYHGEEEIEETRLYFEEGLTLGLNPGYDAGAYDQNSALMTRLVEEDAGHGLLLMPCLLIIWMM
ncbi:MAG: hypothetical protein P8K70_02420 [Flavobacteriaceae bacterium]|nr:hypothetical protein [Flavobacteriaceae bacterium]